MSFQATEWARSLPLPTQSAKFTLMVIGSYADTDGTCFPSLTRLASDTVQSIASTRRRIREFEQLGLLQRFSRWISPDGRVVVTKVGDALRPEGYRQTSDELRLATHLTPADVERMLADLQSIGDGADVELQEGAAEAGGEGITVQPSPPATVTPSPLHSSATPGVSPGSHPLKHDSNSSLEETPQPPDGGAGEAPEPEWKGQPSPITDVRPWRHVDSWSRFEQAWHAPILHQQICRQLWGGLSDDDRELLIGKVAPGYRAWRSRQSRPPTVCNAQKILRERDSWPSYARFAPGAEPDRPAGPPKVFVDLQSDAGHAWETLMMIGGLSMGRVMQRGKDGYMVPDPLPPAVQSLSAVSTPWTRWPFHPSGSNECGAWRRFVADHAGRPAQLRDKLHGIEKGVYAPWRWPPRKDGTRSEEQQQPSEDQ